MKLLIDTNVFLDAMMNRDPWAKAAQDLLIASAEEKVTGCISATSLTDIYYILRKHLKNKEKAKEALLQLLPSIDVLDINGTDCEKALGLSLPDFEDALLACCGERNNVNYIVTRDTKHFENSPVEAIQPEEILEII